MSIHLERQSLVYQDQNQMIMMRMANKLVVNIVVLVILLVASQPIKAAQHEQVHISLGATESEMLITWTTLTPIIGKNPQVWYGLTLNNLSHVARAETENFLYQFTTFHTHRALLSGLKPATVYFYKVGTPNEQWSKVLQFKTLQTGVNWKPTVAIYGDLGKQNARSVPLLNSEIRKRRYDAIFHVGDFAYDLNGRNGQQGHDFMNKIESIASRVPYMTCPGNHEFFGNFSHYDARFSMLGDRNRLDIYRPLKERLNNHFWSVNIGLVHFVAFSTEFYDFTNFGWDQIGEQYRFLEEDLKLANENREHRPWIVVMAHKPMYQTNLKNWSNQETQHRVRIRKGIHMYQNAKKKRQYGLEELFHRYGVDLQFYGHDHYYARLYPFYNFRIYNPYNATKTFRNPGAPIHIVTGAAGNREIESFWTEEYPKWIAKRSLDYGFTRLTFNSPKHMVMEQLSANRNGQVIDRLTVIKHKPKPKWMSKYDHKYEHKSETKYTTNQNLWFT